MGLVRFDRDADNLVSSSYSQGRGPVLRSDSLELTKISFAKGEGAATHQHAEEQILYVLSGRIEATLGDEEYEVGPGEATFNPAGVPHGMRALEDTVALSVKDRVAPSYSETGRLDAPCPS
jgi:quercetin dioxygenase-like cupin family protein